MIAFQAAHTGLPSVVSSAVPAGVAYTLVGTAGGESWTVAEGVGIGASVSVSDPFAPLDVATVYVLTAGALVESASVTRGLVADFGIDTVFSSEDGRDSIAVVWEGDAAMSWSPGAAYAQPLNRRRPVQWLPLRPGGHTWDVECRVDLADVATAQRVFATGRVWVAHSPDRCDGGSSIPRAMLLGVDGDVAEGRWPLGRTYKLKARELDPTVTGVPIVTWGDAKRAGIVWSGAIPTTFAGIRQQIAGA